MKLMTSYGYLDIDGIGDIIISRVQLDMENRQLIVHYTTKTGLPEQGLVMDFDENIFALTTKIYGLITKA